MMLAEMLRDSSNNFWDITLASIGDGVIVTDLRGNTIFFNAAAEEISGWDKEDAANKKICEIFVLIDATTNHLKDCPILNVLDLGIKIGLDENSMLVTKKGDRKYISANISPIKDESGLILGSVMVFRDITRIRESELNIKEEKTNYLNIFNSAPVGIISFDENSRITKVNEAALDFLDSNKENSIGMKFGDAFCCRESINSKEECRFSKQCSGCDIKRTVDLALQAGVETSNIEIYKVFLINKIEVEFWFKASIVPMIENGKKNAVLVLMDITDRKNNETKISKSRDYFLSMFENFPSMVWKTDLNGANEYINNKCCDYLGKTKEECLNMNWFEQFHEEDRERCYKLSHFSFTKRKPYDMEFRILNKKGKYRWIQSINRPIFNTEGKFDGFIGIGLDVSDKKIAEEGLKRYQILTEKVRDIILFTDLKGNIIDVNESALNLYGYTRKEFLKLSDNDLRAKSEPKQEVKIADIRGDFYEIVHKRKDGVEFPIEASAQEVFSEGKRIIVSIIRDITERKKYEKTLNEAKEAAEIANKAKSEFLANMSHEIRTPLNGIVGMVDLTLLGDMNNEQKENLLTAKSCADQLLKVINDILDFSKMEVGKLIVKNINFDIKTLIEETIKIHSPHAQLKGVELNYSFSSQLPRYMNGDPTRLLQILNNLLSNAIKFTENGEVWLKVKKIKDLNKLVEVHFCVEDTGIGISEGNIDEIFKSFIQVDGSFTKKYGGTGLGLSISKQLTEMMGGKLWVESKEGVGSTFHFILQFEIGNINEVKPKQVPKIMKINGSCHVLVVEDDKVNQMVITRILKTRGYSVDTADNGEVAVEMFDKNSYDLILMDIQMPEMDGIEATRLIRERENGKNIPIIAITAYALMGDRENFLSQGMNEYVAKPIIIYELFNAIDKCLPRKNKDEDLSDVGICFDEVGNVILKSIDYSTYQKKDSSHIKELAFQIEELNFAAIKNEFNFLEVIAHQIKVLSNNMEIEELKTMAFKIELSARRGDFVEAIKNAKKMKQIFEVYKKSEL